MTPVLRLVFAGVTGFSISAVDLTDLQALNRELGRMCTRPPQEAARVCQIHARLIKGT
ncbi:MAG: hypothetical protein ACODUE_07675 [Synechococcus sp.]